MVPRCVPLNFRLTILHGSLSRGRGLLGLLSDLGGGGGEGVDS